MADAKR